jgi:hypothetical protein
MYRVVGSAVPLNGCHANCLRVSGFLPSRCPSGSAGTKAADAVKINPNEQVAGAPLAGVCDEGFDSAHSGHFR